GAVAQPAPELHERLRVQVHQLVTRVLPERGGHGGGVERAQLTRSPRAAALTRVLGEATRKRVGRRLAGDVQRREPAGAEVDRVNDEHVARDVPRWPVE